MRDEQLAPIYSTKAEDPELLESISDFVLTLAETVDRLQDSQSAGDYGQLRSLCLALEAAAGDFGYPRASEIAREIGVACALEKEESIELGLLAITNLSQCIRLGHRGAA